MVWLAKDFSETGLKKEGASDADAPSLAAGKFVRVTAKGVFVEADAL